MLTLKVITTDINGQIEVSLLSGDSIVHKEYFSTDHYIISKIQKDNPTTWIIGDIPASSSTQKFIASDVFIYDEERCIKNQLFITPKSECYIMDEGKTIDSFFCTYEQDNL